jgi:hypothetical protein
MPAPGGKPKISARVKTGRDAAVDDIEHQAEHWASVDHGQVGQFIAAVLRAAAGITRSGGLRCEHYGGTTSVAESLFNLPEMASLTSDLDALTAHFSRADPSRSTSDSTTRQG